MLAKSFWRKGNYSSAAIIAPYRALLPDDNPFSKSAKMEVLLTDLPPVLLHREVPLWKGPFVGLVGRGHGLRGFVSSLHSQHWSSSLFVRSFATLKGKLERRKRDLARREFQLLRRKTKLLKATLSPEERLLWRLRKANRKRGVLLQRLQKYELEEDPEPVHDPELITAEQLQALKKVGYKNRNYVPVGRRGVYGGVVLNMHMHWKFHETVQIDCHIFKREDVRSVARQLAILSGGIVIDIHQATTIIMYRGRNYKQPKKQMTPPNTLTKRKALFKSKHLQALESLDMSIRNVEGELQVLRRTQKENAAAGTESDTGKLQQVAGNQLDVNKVLSNMSDDLEDQDDDSGVFSWGSDSLDEDELSDSEVDQEAVSVVHEEKVTKPINWTSGDSVPQRGKKKRLTAKELILAEQELFRQKRAETERSMLNSHSSGNTQVVSESLKTDDEEDNSVKDDGHQKVDSSKNFGSKKDVENSKGATRQRVHEQIQNKKIAKLMEDFESDSEEELEGFMSDEDLDSDFDGLENPHTRASTEGTDKEL